MSSRSWRAPFVAVNRWSISTVRRRHNDRAPSSMRCATTPSGRTPTSIAGSTSLPRRQPTPTKAPVPGSRGRSAGRRDEVVFTRGTTEALNLAAALLGLEACARATKLCSPGSSTTRTSCRGSCSRRAKGRRSVSPSSTPLAISISTHLARLLGPRTRIVSLAHVSNTLGTVLPIAQIAAAGPPSGSPAGRRRCPGDRPSPGRRGRPRLRRLHLLRPQGLRANGGSGLCGCGANCSPRHHRGRVAVA